MFATTLVNNRKEAVMPTINAANQATTTSAIDELNLGRLEARIRELQDECNGVRQALTKSEAERDRYRQAFLDQLRELREFENLDIPTLEAMSAGPVEPIR